MQRRRLTVLASAMSLLVALAAGCGSGTSSSGGGSDANPDTLVRTTPAPSGDLTKFSWALSYEPTSLDYVYAYNYAENTVLSNVCESLMRLTPSYKIVPSLATSATHPSPTTWVYNLRPGVRFNDGSTMTADDAVYSLKRQIDSKVGSYWGSWWANVKTIDQTGPMQVTITLKKPDVIFPQMMATPAGEIESKAFLTEQGSKYGTPDGGLDCTGPFALKTWNKGQSIVLQRNPNYWDHPLRARSQQVEFVFLDSETTRASALQSGQVDGTFDVPPSDINNLMHTGNGKVYFGPSMQSFDAIVSSFKGPLGDSRIRRALLLALDRQGIVNAALGGRAQVLRSVVAPSSWGYSQPVFLQGYNALPPTTMNLDAAKRLVAQAGTPTQPIVLATLAGDSQLSIISLALQDAARKLGLNLQIKTLPVAKYATLFFDPKARQGLDIFLTGWYTDIPEPLNMWSTIFMTGGGSNYNGYSNPTYDKLIGKADQTENLNARAALINQGQEILTHDVPWIPLYAPDVRVFLNSRITGVPTTFVYLYSPWAAAIGAS
jgi:peptide/nickel transport system substrate-binding protein